MSLDSLKRSLPLEGITIVDFSQFLSAPSATLRLADLGARVIKIERPKLGDICRNLYTSNVSIDGVSTVFHAINRNKESFSADLKNKSDVDKVRSLIANANVLVHNFRPGVMNRLGFDYPAMQKINPQIIYASISGYGDEGPWREKPGQDLLLQSLSGLTTLSGNAGDGPVPMGLAMADIFSGAQLVQGILAALVRQGITGEGALVEISMLESILDFQFEPLTVYFQDGGQEIQRTSKNNALANLGAPYGIYKTANGHLSLAMGAIPKLGELLSCEALLAYSNPNEWFSRRDEIKEILERHLQERNTSHWLSLLEPADIWCAEVMDWKQLRTQEAYQVLMMEQEVIKANGVRYQTTRCPIRINGERLYSSIGSPDIGESNERISKEFQL